MTNTNIPVKTVKSVVQKLIPGLKADIDEKVNSAVQTFERIVLEELALFGKEKTPGIVLRIENGRFYSGMGGNQFYSNGQPFAFGYDKVKTVKTGAGEMIWQNSRHKEIAGHSNDRYHEGSLIVELVPDAKTDHVPSDVEISGGSTSNLCKIGN